MSRRASLLLASLVLTLTVSSPLRAAAPPSPQAREVVDAVEAWDLPLARERLRALIDAAPDSRDRKWAEARLAIDEADYPRAARLYDALGVEDELSPVAHAEVELTSRYEVQESDHFSFHYPPGKDAVLAPYALETLERAYAAMGSALGYWPAGKVRVEVLEDAQALSRVTTLPLPAVKTTGTIAICKFNRLMITSPKALVHGYPWLDTLAHEYTHLVISQATRNQVPIWIHEGLAKYFETAWRGNPGEGLTPSAAALLSKAASKNQLIAFERMSPSIALLPSQEEAALAYAEVFTAIEYLDHLRAGAMPSLLAAMRAGRTPQEAIGEAAGSSFAQFEQGWKTYLSRRPFPKEALSAKIEKMQFTEDASRNQKPPEKKKEEIRFGDFLEIENSEGRQFAHLGELLRARGRNLAAVHEFAKAYGRVGSRSVVLSNRYAQALLSLRQNPEAEEVLLTSARLYPGYPRTQLNLGKLYRDTARPEEAIRALNDVIGIDPFDPEPHALLIPLYRERGSAPEAARERAALEKLTGESPSPVATQGVLDLTSRPYARVFLDGVDTGRTTPTKLRVEPGSHRLKLVNTERGNAKELEVTLGAGELRELNVELGE